MGGWNLGKRDHDCIGPAGAVLPPHAGPGPSAPCSLRPDTLSSGEWRAQQEQAAQQAAAEELAAAAASLSSVEVEPRRAVDALDAAHRSTQLPGSATACVLRLDGRTGQLDAANLGDSGFLVVRDGALHFQSPAQQHFFDCPLQFGQPPDTDWAEDAAVFSLQLRPGDAIVLATDGLLDNLPAEDIVRLAPRSAADVQRAAAAMAELAARNAADPDYESPYTREALQEGFDIPIWEKLLQARIKDGKLELGKLRGGKMDDITVVCAYVAPVEGS
jgi:protein phosphatase PTC7